MELDFSRIPALDVEPLRNHKNSLTNARSVHLVISVV